jgi:DMSO/TMAO reductase YedYZ molybdopterin-dependent catalytic subunit
MPSKNEPDGSARTDPLRPHRHEPNPEPPSADPSFQLIVPARPPVTVTIAHLMGLPYTRIAGCTIVSTGHGTAGPFTFGGVAVADLLRDVLSSPADVESIEVISGDGYGTRIGAAELAHPGPVGPLLFAYEMDGRPLTRAEGLVRLIVPQERDDALRQVKWIASIRIRSRFPGGP